MLDLEDAVAPDDKERAREQVIAALRELDWSGCSVSLRINGLDTHWCYRDIVDVVEQAGDRRRHGPHPEGRRAPATSTSSRRCCRRSRRRSGCRTDRHQRADRDRRRACTTSTRSPPRARSGWRRWCSASPTTPPRCRATRRRSAARRRRTPCAPTTAREHWGDQWHYPLARIAVACRAHGLRPIDGPYGDFGDPEGYRTAARRAAVLGYEGKWAIHPSQIALANEVFTPDAAAAEKTRRIVAAMAEAAREGRGAVSLDGRLIDAASLRMAEVLLHEARADRGARERTAGAGGGGMTRRARRARRPWRRAAARCASSSTPPPESRCAARRPDAARRVRGAAAGLRRRVARAVAPGAAHRRLPRRRARAAPAPRRHRRRR